MVMEFELRSLLEAAQRAQEFPEEVVEQIGDELFQEDSRYINEKLYRHLEWMLDNPSCK